MGRVRGTVVTYGRGQGIIDHPDPPQHQPATDEDVTATLGDDATFAPFKIRWIKADIHLVITRYIFKDNPVYGAQYAVAGNKPKFDHAVTNHLTYLRGIYKSATDQFRMTGTGINPLDPLTKDNLQDQITVQVASEFLWFKDLDALWKDNLVFSPKTFSSTPGKDCAGGLQVLTQPTPYTTASDTYVLNNSNLDDINTNLNDMNPDLDDSLNKGTPAAAIEDYDSAYDNYDPIHNDHDPSLEDHDYMMGQGG
ncbi:hypothetical protein EDD22DRAFT_849403 [Suillus occidentalis]|nr:hypothetical protein EDD22DRAFT_849403 [Suillus occidentalis]